MSVHYIGADVHLHNTEICVENKKKVMNRYSVLYKKIFTQGCQHPGCPYLFRGYRPFKSLLSPIPSTGGDFFLEN